MTATTRAEFLDHKYRSRSSKRAMIPVWAKCYSPMRYKACYTDTDIIITSIFITNPNQYEKTIQSITARRTKATFLEEWSYGETLQRALTDDWRINGREGIRDAIQLAQGRLRRQSGGRGSQLAKKRETFKKEVKNYIQQNKDKF